MAGTKEEPRRKRLRDGDDRQLDLSLIPKNIVQTVHVCSGHKKPKKLMITLEKIRKEEESGTRDRSLIIVFFKTIKNVIFVGNLLRKEGASSCPVVES